MDSLLKNLASFSSAREPPVGVSHNHRSTDKNAHPIAAVGGLTPTWDDQGQSRGVQTQGVVVAT